MATLEKPKIQKTKKSKGRETRGRNPERSFDDDKQVESVHSAIVVDDRRGDPSTVDDSDQYQLDDLEGFVFPNITTTHADLISHECSVADGYRGGIEELNEDNIQEVALSDDEEDSHTAESTKDDAHENISLHDELMQAAATTAEAKNVSSSPQPWTTNFELPSAPPELEASSAVSAAPQSAAVILPSAVSIHYPDLLPLQQVETKTEVVYRQARTKHAWPFLSANSRLKPFSEEQLKEIYYCSDLELVKQFELEFLMNSLLESYAHDPLHAALFEYYRLQSKLTMNSRDVQQYSKKALESQEKIWTEVPVKRTFSGRCADNVELKESVTYNIAQVDGKNLEAATAAINELFDLVSKTCTTNQISARIIKVKIDQIITEIVSYPRISILCKTGQLSLNNNLDAETLQCAAHLRRAISILFYFVRKPSPNKTFDKDLKLWLTRLVSLHLLIATKEDHWFLLFNILRCPTGVGTWATSFLQVPGMNVCNGAGSTSSPSGSCPSELPLQLTSPEISHCIAVLQILLLPIKKRNEYLKEFLQFPKEISDPIREDRWILIDSDGEDSQTPSGDCVGLKESDLISLLNQIPFERLFGSALTVEKFLNDYIIKSDVISAHQMLKVVAFFSKLIEIFGEGMLTYNTERYKQLAKRLGRLVRHTLQYAADYHQLFIGNNLSKDPFVCERIAMELNALLIKACSFIYRTRNLATWQYFSSLPFLTMETSTVWQIFYYLNVGFPTELPIPCEDYIEMLNASDFWAKFNVANADSSAEDLYYLLQAFYEMANERDKTKDWELIKIICLHIFNIGFINEKTREVCYKAARDILVNLTLGYGDLISSLLLQLKIRFSEIDNSAYLFKSLPLENWKPGMDSFEILSNWLLHFDFKSAENMLARIVISHLNWGFDCEEGGRLFLPHNIHVRMACLVTEALNKHAPEVVGTACISESVRQVTGLIEFSQTPKEQFSSWCWNMANILRLHLMDQSPESVKNTLQDPAEPLLFIPDLERIDIVFQGVTEKRPLAIYVSILVSLWGHSIPLICQKGLEQLKLLLNDRRHAVVIRCLELLVPLFLETPETLANCESFHVIFTNLLNADKTYLKMAKDMISVNSVGPVLELLDNMIHHQINNYTHYGLATPLNLINIWLNCLTNIPNWQQTNVTYLLDKVLRVAYQFPDARIQAVEYFRYYYKDCQDWKGINKVSSLKTFFSSNVSRIPVLSPSHGWLALVLLEVEFKMQEMHFWPEFMRQLVAANPKMNLESAFKKTASIRKFSTYSPHMLVIYKYANLIANMEVSHPVFPIMNQKFFELFLSRATLDYEENSFQQFFGASDKFYEFNVPLMKKIKANLKIAETYYASQAAKTADDESHSYFYRNCAKIMKTFSLWLEETSINKMTSEQQNLPPQYNTEKLSEIFKGNTSHWTEFLHLPSIRKLQQQQADIWARKFLRHKTSKRLRSPPPAKLKTTPVERIKNNLCSYDKRLDAPCYSKPQDEMPKKIDKRTQKLLEDHMKVLTSTVNKLNLHVYELNSLNRNYLDIVVTLYKMVPYEAIKIKNCTTLMFNRTCSGPARITTELKQIRKNEEVVRQIAVYRERHDKIVDALLAMNADDFAYSIELIRSVVRTLNSTQLPNSNKSDIITSTAITFFYKVIDCMTDVMLKFTPTNDFCSQILNDLGIFIQENQEREGATILELAMKRPNLLKALAGLFVPYRTTPPSFLKMYKLLVDSHLERCNSEVLFVLLSKFDMPAWLEAFHPKLYDIHQLLQLVLRGLECWSQTDSSLLQDLYRRHLVHIFQHDFPEHYGEVMQMVLDRISDQKLMPVVLTDLLNALLARFSCDTFDLALSAEQIREISEDFARRQNLFNLKAATDTVMLFARHFQKERLHHGLHGLYPKHADYCVPLSMWFSCFGHIVVVTAICTYQELLADQISDVIFSRIVEMYAPWLVSYTEETLPQPPANWIRQLSGNDQLLPWSEMHTSTSKIMIQSFIDTIVFVLNSLPVSNKILSHTFSWYVHHFAKPNMVSYVQSPIHEGIAQLPWELFKPQPDHIDMLYESLEAFVPESHAMLGHIFIRLNWNSWVSQLLPTWATTVQHTVVSRLLTIFVKIAFEPNIHTHTNTSKILEEAIAYPWHMVECDELEKLLKWFVSSTEPSITLKLPTETNYTDRAVLDLLRLASAMMPEHTLPVPIKHDTAKRILYTRAWVRLLRSCASKNRKLLATKDGLNAYNAAFIELLNTMDNCIRAMARDSKALDAQRREALYLMIEVLAPMQTQSEETTGLHIDSLIHWQAQCAAGDLLCCATLDAIGYMKGFTVGIYTLLEATIAHYFKRSEETKDWHNPSWASLLQILKTSLDKLELMPLLNGSHFFALHVFILYKIETLSSLGDQIIFLQDLSQLVENLKTSEHTEPRIALIWGVIISRGVRILAESENVKKALLMLARQLHTTSTKGESWGEGLLGAIGLKRDGITNKRKVLSRCLSCIIFSLFPDTSSTSTVQHNREFLGAMQEMTTLLANKKFLNVKPLVVKAIGILNEKQPPSFPDVPHFVCRIIALFYNHDFLLTVPEVWQFDFRLN